MSWMRRFEVREWGLSDEITQLILPPSDGIPPVLPLYLRELDWWLNETNLPFLLKFLSPELTKININTNAPVGPTETFKPWNEIPDRVFTIIRSAIKMFPSAGLQKLGVILGVGPKTDLTEEISAFVLEHGEALQDLCTNSVLSTQAIVRLMKLPHFSSWVTEQGPPSVTELIHHGVPDGAASLFPSLGMLNFMSEAAFVGWLSLFEAAKSRTPPWTIAGDGLPGLSYGNSILPVDSTLIFRLLPHGSLVDVKIGLNCSPFRPCASRFTDQDAERLAIALPKLEALSLGERPCRADTCPTTIRSLLSFSIHCPKLRYLSIHFRTANLRADMLDLLSYAYTQGLHSRPKCVLNGLMIGEMRGDFADSDPGLISIGMLMIFPSLTKFGTRSPAWGRLELLVNTLRQTEGTAHLTEKLVMYISRARELARDGTPGRSAVSFHFSSALAAGECEWFRLFIDVTLYSSP